MKKIYLATPYSDPDPAIRAARFVAVNRVAARLMSEGLLVFSPISHGHPIALSGDLPRGWEFWREYVIPFIEWCDEVHVFMQPGWEDSVGVSAETLIAIEMDKPVVYIEDDRQGL